MSQYGILPSRSWGTATDAAKGLWNANECDFKNKTCFYMAHKYGITLASIPAALQPSFTSLNCAAVVTASKCTKVSGYVATEGVARDAPADDLGYYPANASATCSANPKCLAFSAPFVMA
ncbi:hypothetical protein GPECTOR_1744g844 [Gonium pectorale]|uniref:Uncharacterized protein n=1 Tax=Gonium pectorale TaxID=33097 RepID=A0A150FTB6_GONPE|nr:hypothetical protein GPECTOR_1744g844 [Gonium pectorale]|eukprot:KXZ40863.1 hypothetical protein GPECTOR_1744g844 [Gonium pectorale]